MTRKESQKDRANELAIVKVLAKHYGVTFKRYPAIYSPADFGLFDAGVLVAIVECRQRNDWSWKKGDVALNVSKAEYVARYCGLNDLNFYFAVRMEGEVRVAQVTLEDLEDLTPAPLRRKWEHHSELVYPIPVEWFKPIG